MGTSLHKSDVESLFFSSFPSGRFNTSLVLRLYMTGWFFLFVSSFICLCYRSQPDQPVIFRINFEQISQLSHTICLPKQKRQLHSSIKQKIKTKSLLSSTYSIQSHQVILAAQWWPQSPFHNNIRML